MGEIPVFEEPGLRLTQTGPILPRLAERYSRFSGEDEGERFEVLHWLFRQCREGVYDFPIKPEQLGACQAKQLERLLALNSAPRSASCIDGGRARPPEDVGGVHGYAAFLDIIADPDNPEHRATKRWAGGPFDPEWFDLEMTDKDVRNALWANRRIRLHQPRAKTRTRSS